MTDLTKLTVHLVPRSVEALGAAAEATGDTRTDTVNRALQAYAEMVAHPGEFFCFRPDGTLVRAVAPTTKRPPLWPFIALAVSVLLVGAGLAYLIGGPK